MTAATIGHRTGHNPTRHVDSPGMALGQLERRARRVGAVVAGWGKPVLVGMARQPVADAKPGPQPTAPHPTRPNALSSAQLGSTRHPQGTPKQPETGEDVTERIPGDCPTAEAGLSACRGGLADAAWPAVTCSVATGTGDVAGCCGVGGNA